MTSIVNLAPEPKRNGGGLPAGGVKGYGIDRDFIARFNESGYRPFMAAKAHAPEGWRYYSYSFPLDRDSKGRHLPHAPQHLWDGDLPRKSRTKKMPGDSRAKIS